MGVHLLCWEEEGKLQGDECGGCARRGCSVKLEDRGKFFLSSCEFVHCRTSVSSIMRVCVCKNRPTLCPLSTCNHVIWSYCLTAHLKLVHGLSTEAASAVVTKANLSVSSNEREAVLKKKTTASKTFRSRTARKKGGGKCSKSSVKPLDHESDSDNSSSFSSSSSSSSDSREMDPNFSSASDSSSEDKS